MHCVVMYTGNPGNVVYASKGSLWLPVKPIHTHRGQLQVVHGVVRSSNRTKWVNDDGSNGGEQTNEQGMVDGAPSSAQDQVGIAGQGVCGACYILDDGLCVHNVFL